MRVANIIAEKFQKWMEENLPQFLVDLPNLSPDFADANWTMPMVEEFVVVVAVRDVDDNGGSVMAFASPDTPPHRIRGLLHEALL